MAKAAPHRSLIGSKIGNYSILSTLGEGGMGVVYLAEHPQIGKRVAIKVLHADHAARADAAQRAFLEARAVNEIRHPNVVDIIDCGIVEIDGERIHYLLMEYLEGESLREVVRRGALPVEHATAIAVEVARALAAAHAKGIIHRDIKPENIFIAREGEAETVKVLDFGIAKLLDGRAFGDRLTLSGVTLGTPQYMAPEQLDGEDIDGRADVYALGIVLFEMITGAAPFAEETTARGVWRRMNELPTLTPEQRAALPAGLEDLMMRTLDPDRIRRPEMADLARALVDPGSAEPATGGDPHTVRIAKHASASKPKLTPRAGLGHAETRSTPTVDAMPSARSRLPLAIGVLGAVALIAVVVILFASRRDTSVEPTKPQPRDVKPPGDEIVTVTIESTPAGAEVFVGDETAPRGRTPLELPLVKGSPTVQVRLMLAGYTEVRRSISTLRNDRLSNLLGVHPAREPSDPKPPVKPPVVKQPALARTPAITPPAVVDAGVPAAPADAAVRGDDIRPPKR